MRTYAGAGITVALVLLIGGGVNVVPARGDVCILDHCYDPGGASGNAGDGSFRITLWSSNGDSVNYVVDQPSPQHRYEWSWVPTCDANSPLDPNGMCGGASGPCPDPADIRYWIYYRDLDVPGDSWHQVGIQCLGPDPTLPLSQAQGEVARAFRDLPMTAGSLRVQPRGNAIVNLPTIFYVDTPARLPFTVTALGRTVRLVATPRTWHWHWGDGSADGSTDNPGAAYPHQTVTHRYARAGTVRAWVTVDWVATYTIAGIDRTFTITDPVAVRSAAVSVTVREARSQLVSQG